MNNSHCKPAIQSPRRSLWTRKSWTPLKKKKKKNTRIARSISSSHRGRRDETSTHSSIHPLGAWETVASPSLESTNAKKKKKKTQSAPFSFCSLSHSNWWERRFLGDEMGEEGDGPAWAGRRRSTRRGSRGGARRTSPRNRSPAAAAATGRRRERERWWGATATATATAEEEWGKIRAGKIKEKAYGDGKWASPFWFF